MRQKNCEFPVKAMPAISISRPFRSFLLGANPSLALMLARLAVDTIDQTTDGSNRIRQAETDRGAVADLRCGVSSLIAVALLHDSSGANFVSSLFRGMSLSLTPIALAIDGH